MSNSAQKDVIYVDVDDEITGLIDKVRQSEQKIVALVLPKRATVLQSVVNMKLLKRTTDDTKKRIVLITSETALLPLAGAVGMYVAKTLQSRPEIPTAPQLQSDAPVNLDDAIEDVPLDRAKPIGAYTDEDDEPIEVDEVDEAASSGVVVPDASKGPNKKLKVPNFERFRLLIILGGVGLLLLLVGFVVANSVLPKARVVIKTDTTTVDTNLSFTSGVGIKTLDEERLLVPAVSKEIKKTDMEKVAATGERDDGTKATGTVTLRNCSRTDGAVTLPAGTGVSSNNLTFITATEVILPASAFSGGGTCLSATKDVDVTAQNAGDKYNLAAGRTWTVAGYSSITGTDNTAMTGGTSKITKVVSQLDVDTAKAKLTERTTTTATEELKRQLEKDGLLLIPDTLNAGTPTITSAPEVNKEATETIVTLTTTYTAQGVKKEDVQKLVETEAKKSIDNDKQTILDNGLDKAELRLTEKKANNTVQLSIAATVVAGPQLDADSIKRDIAGKKKGEAKNIIAGRPGIKETTIEYSPFWVSKTPKKADKITVVFEQDDSTDNR